MQALVEVILPVFGVIGFGYLAVWRGWFAQVHVDGLMRFTQNFAIPCLLFSAIARLDLGAGFDWRLLLSFYSGAFLSFLAGTFIALRLFGRELEEAIAVGFCCLFSNSVLLGLLITERAYGPEALVANYAIIAVHSPFCYGVGITAMELARARGAGRFAFLPRVGRAMFSNALIIGIGLGFAVNLSGLAVPAPLWDGVTLLARAALPAALFGLGGVLVQYKPQGDLRLIACVMALSLLVHPAITRALAALLELPDAATRSAVVTAAMAPGVNSYIFANMYGRARKVAASSVLLATAVTPLTAWLWLGLLP
ncbi:AEC family transporter [Roseovarius sp. SCSIO 43702]|uniref:AEC family transporter n=1 Tax=Roseovarius sp. SCSIO 43702 TaxID=2823043 RepID=UPI001C73BA44|nr:AEC family transporter [Roseovarius sp. SCSIO 43702]QYX55935.1 AEC family transporter [Roseovarius sp. SCSIO 43702]